MKKYTCVALLLCLLEISAHAQLPANYSSRLQFVLDSVCEKYNIKGASAAVVVPVYGVWEGTHGESYAGEPIAPDMILGLGSNTKTYVAALMLKLQEQGTLDLDDTVGAWIQHANVNGQITIRQLLNHTSGLYNYTNSTAWGNAIGSNLDAVWQPENILQFIEAPEFVAGTDWDYSNTNFLLAGLIAKDATGQSLSSLLNTHVLTPQGLDATYMLTEEATPGTVPHVWSAAFNGAGFFMEDLISEYGYSHNAMMSAAWAAGGLVATAKDNALFWSKLIDGDILSNDSWNEMTEFTTVSGSMDYGLGIMRYDNFAGQTVYSHGGTNLGFINENIADPATGVTISVLTNQDSISNNILLTRVVRALYNVTLDETTSLVESNLQSFSVYPNPASAIVYVDSKRIDSKILVYDLTGRLVMQNALVANVMNVSSLPNGCYLVKLQTQDKTQLVQKLFVER